jgi:hypothetical protein
MKSREEKSNGIKTKTKEISIELGQNKTFGNCEGWTPLVL